MLVIGLTGPSGSGKGKIADLFSAYGLPVINADEVYHQLLIPPSLCLEELTDHFGVGILSTDGTLNRRALGAIVFSDPAALDALNTITHHHVMSEIRRRLEQLRREDTRAAVIDAPQLFEAGADRDCNVIISVIADKLLRLDRIMRRDGIDEDAARKRMEAQKTDAFFRAHSDYVIENNTVPEALLPEVRRILFEMGVLSCE